jgi:hypothetical protein
MLFNVRTIEIRALGCYQHLESTTVVVVVVVVVVARCMSQSSYHLLDKILPHIHVLSRSRSFSFYWRLIDGEKERENVETSYINSQMITRDEGMRETELESACETCVRENERERESEERRLWSH